MIRKRARTAEAKAARRHEILAAAASLFDEVPFQEVKIASVAERAGVAKGTVYVYFDTKEAMFLELFVRELESWTASLAESIIGCEPGAPVIEMIVCEVADRPLFCRLASLLHAVLEQNVDTATAAMFKRSVRDATAPVISAIKKRMYGLDELSAVHLMLRVNAVIVGLYPACVPPPAVAAAHDESDLTVFHMDFREHLTAVLLALFAPYLEAAPAAV